MKRLTKKCQSMFAGLVLVISVTACKPGQVFGPNTGLVSVRVASLMRGDTLTVYLSRVQWAGEGTGEEAVRLTDAVPVYSYWVRIQTREWWYYNGVECGTAYANVWSAKLKAVSQVKSVGVCTDQIASFSFSRFDFLYGAAQRSFTMISAAF